jgi:hypothetical protein
MRCTGVRTVAHPAHAIAGDGVVPAEGANEIVPAPAIDGVGSVRADDHVVGIGPDDPPRPVMVAFLPR